MKYAGIGSRETPEHICEEMKDISFRLSKCGFILRSGGAKGADSSFEYGCDKAKGKKQIFLSEHATKESINLALKYHPNPKALKRKGNFVLGLMGRNMQIISGLNLDDNVDFVVCWTKDGKDTGGTGQAIRYCNDIGIHIYNLYNETNVNELIEFLMNLENT
jgi:hypothetical protein